MRLRVCFVYHEVDPEFLEAFYQALVTLDEDWYDLAMLDCPDRATFLKQSTRPTNDFTVCLCSLLPTQFLSIGKVNRAEQNQACVINFGDLEHFGDKHMSPK